MFSQNNNHKFDVPTRWSRTKASRLLTIDDNNLRIKYNGLGQNDDEAAALIANSPFRYSMNIGYFEIYIIEDGCDNGLEGKIGIGFGSAKTSVRQLPGWFPGSYGYHGDDGNIFHSQFNGMPYSTSYGKGDIVGCCIDYKIRSIFFTKNGINLGHYKINYCIVTFY
ncbi:2300_t:CDS:2 [Dentiscutata heterogama]|uniref:2300_t:CDS:1 n=1 Tax=Dentiscutata heterogama TaxID=1316150 RepID=A0ACA9KEA4_9GLOM|nr:2300_t:CDS:2 [Dentiscutata heterogama]